MAVTVSATLVGGYIAGPAAPAVALPVPHNGWNNLHGDRHWVGTGPQTYASGIPLVPDIDFYRRVQLVCSGSAGEVGTVVNWEITDDTLQMKTNTEITVTAKAGAVASPYGTTVNNSGTWTVWATTGVATAGQDKYTDTKTPVISKLRANGPRVQVVLGKHRPTANKTWTAAAFLPGGAKTPAGTASITTTTPTSGIGGTMVEQLVAEAKETAAETVEKAVNSVKEAVDDEPKKGKRFKK